MPEQPALTVVLATDGFSTIEPVVDALRRQTARERIELVIVTTRTEELRTVPLDDFAAARVVGVEAVIPLARARAAGVRVATAPIVFIGETHVFPQPGWAQALIDAHAGPWAAVVPGFGNANPVGALSWAGFLADYGAWLSVLPGRELESVPTYNTAYKRSALLGQEPLEAMLTTGDSLQRRLRASGQRFVFAPAAHIDHANVSRPWHWLAERYFGGLLVAHSRMQGWSRRRRLVYAAGSPLIPLVCLARVRHGVAAAVRSSSLPVGTLAALAAGAVASAAGELVGYLGGPIEEAERRMTEYEVHKLRYAGPQ